jgi:hypothetical protein
MGANLPSVDLGYGWTVVEVAVGRFHTCARLENGAARAVKCWGYNDYGQLGLGDTNHRGAAGGEMGDSLPAVQLGTGRSAVALTLGPDRSCALLDDGSVKCWGGNWGGQLGLGDRKNNWGDEGGEMGDSLLSLPLCPGPCLWGYTGPDGGACNACEAGTYKATAGSGSCAACPLHSSSAAGSDELTDCACDAGYTGPDGGTCAACFDCDSVVTFTAFVFTADNNTFVCGQLCDADMQDAYVAGVAQAVSVTPARVAISSITDESPGHRLLAAFIAVATKVTVAPALLSAVLFWQLSHRSLQCLAASPLALSAGEQGMWAADCPRGAAGPEGQGRGSGRQGHGREPQSRARVLGYIRRYGLVARDRRHGDYELRRTRRCGTGWHRRRGLCLFRGCGCWSLLLGPLQEGAARADHERCAHPRPSRPENPCFCS